MEKDLGYPPGCLGNSVILLGLLVIFVKQCDFKGVTEKDEVRR